MVKHIGLVVLAEQRGLDGCTGQICLSKVKSAGFPPIIPFMLSSQRMQAQYSLFLSDDHCGFTSFADMDQSNYVHGTWIARGKERVWGWHPFTGAKAC